MSACLPSRSSASFLRVATNDNACDTSYFVLAGLGEPATGSRDRTGFSLAAPRAKSSISTSQPDRFWGPRLPPSRQGTRWLDVLKVQVCYRLIDPGSDWRLHRHWYAHSALRDLLGTDRVLTSDTLY